MIAFRARRAIRKGRRGLGGDASASNRDGILKSINDEQRNQLTFDRPLDHCVSNRSRAPEIVRSQFGRLFCGPAGISV